MGRAFTGVPGRDAFSPRSLIRLRQTLFGGTNVSAVPERRAFSQWAVRKFYTFLTAKKLAPKASFTFW
ncbi:MAG TPA: hypothetical protein VK085_02970 [Pseudogracilibacillus sp.]|nr:hypothetical protein [Pseudogracilibacillus sp.]